MSEVLEVAGSGDEVVMLDYLDEPGLFANVFRVSPLGREVWRAAPPGPEPDAWTEVDIQGDEVVVRSWTGWRVGLDLATGSERWRERTT